MMGLIARKRCRSQGDSVLCASPKTQRREDASNIFRSRLRGENGDMGNGNDTCKVCGSPVPQSAVFCPMCGARLEHEGREGVNPAIVEMVEQFSKRVNEHPEDAAAHYNLALALIMLRRWGAAAQVLEKVIQLEPSFLEAHFHLARSYIALGNLDAAHSVVSQMMRQSPDDRRTKRALRLLQRAHAKQAEKMSGNER